MSVGRIGYEISFRIIQVAHQRHDRRAVRPRCSVFGKIIDGEDVSEAITAGQSDPGVDRDKRTTRDRAVACHGPDSPGSPIQ